MDINQMSSFSKLTVGDKRKHLYAIYVIEQLLLKGSITIVNDEFNIYNLDISYVDTFDSRLYNKMQSKTSGMADTDATQSATLDPEYQCRQIPKPKVDVDVPETPSKKARKPRAKKTDVEEQDDLQMNIPIIAEVPEEVPETPSKKGRKPRAPKQADAVVLEKVVEEPVLAPVTVLAPAPVEVPETPSKKGRKPKAVVEGEVPETPSKKGRKPKADVVVAEGEVPETPSKKGRKPKASKASDMTTIDEVTGPPAPVQKSIADKIVDCVPDKKGKKSKVAKEPAVVVETERANTPELVEDDMPTMSLVEAESEDGSSVTYLLDEKTRKIYEPCDHKLKLPIGMLSEEGELTLFEFEVY